MFKPLKLFGLDVPAIMDSVKAGLDLRFEHAMDVFTRTAVQAAVIAALLVFAAVAGAMAFGVAMNAVAFADHIGGPRYRFIYRAARCLTKISDKFVNDGILCSWVFHNLRQEEFVWF